MITGEGALELLVMFGMIKAIFRFLESFET